MLRYNPLKPSSAIEPEPVVVKQPEPKPDIPKPVKAVKPKEEWRMFIEWHDMGFMPIVGAKFKTVELGVKGLTKPVKLYPKSQVEPIPTDPEARKAALERGLQMERGFILPNQEKPAVVKSEAPKEEPKKQEPDRLKEALRNQVLRNKYAWVIVENAPDMLDVHPDFLDKVKSLGTVNGNSITILFTFGERVIRFNDKQSVMNPDGFTLLSGDKQTLTRLVELVMDIYNREAMGFNANQEEPVRIINGKSYRPPKGMTWKQFDEKYGVCNTQ